MAGKHSSEANIFVERQSSGRKGFKVLSIVEVEGARVMVDWGWVPAEEKEGFRGYRGGLPVVGVLRRRETSNPTLQRQRIQAGVEASAVDLHLFQSLAALPLYPHLYLERV